MVPASEMLSELSATRDRMVDCMVGVALDLKRRDRESILRWAREECAYVIFNLHTE